jgi:hypothetical protein
MSNPKVYKYTCVTDCLDILTVEQYKNKVVLTATENDKVSSTVYLNKEKAKDLATRLWNWAHEE